MWSDSESGQPIVPDRLDELLTYCDCHFLRLLILYRGKRPGSHLRISPVLHRKARHSLSNTFALKNLLLFRYKA